MVWNLNGTLVYNEIRQGENTATSTAHHSRLTLENYTYNYW